MPMRRACDRQKHDEKKACTRSLRAEAHRCPEQKRQRPVEQYWSYVRSPRLAESEVPHDKQTHSHYTRFQITTQRGGEYRRETAVGPRDEYRNKRQRRQHIGEKAYAPALPVRVMSPPVKFQQGDIEKG